MNHFIYRYTFHFRQRFIERIKKETWNGFCPYDKEIRTLFNQSKEILGWQNDNYFVDYLKKKYGNCKMKIFFLKDMNLIFILKRDENITTLFYFTTCYFLENKWKWTQKI